jgi:AcrR family transcriptional regulator
MQSPATNVARIRSDTPGLQAFDRDAQRQLKREAVLRAAASSFNRQGFANTSMEDVAKTLGVSKPTLYQYFPRKEDILYECHQISMGHAETGIAMAVDLDGAGLEKLLVFFRRYMRGMLGEFGSCPVLTNVDSLSPKRRQEVVDRRARISSAAREFIKLGIKDGTVVRCSPGLGALFALGAVNWIPLWYREDGANTPDQIVDAFVGFLRASLSSQSAKGGALGLASPVKRYSKRKP